MIFDQSSADLYNLYATEILNEYAPAYLNQLRKENTLHNLYLMCGYNEEGIIDTIYELYITSHMNMRGGQRGCTKEQLLQYMDTCLECVPVEQLDVPYGSIRSVVFDILNQDTPAPSDLFFIPCNISAAKETTLTTKLKGVYPKVVVCDILVKSVVKSKMAQFGNIDINNAAIHIPIASNGSSITLDDVKICCNTKELTKLLENGFDVEPIMVDGIEYCKGYRNEIPYYTQQEEGRPKQWIFNYAEFFNALYDMRYINKPVSLCYYNLGYEDEITVTNGKYREIKKFDNAQEVELILNSKQSSLFNIEKSPVDYRADPKNAKIDVGKRALNRLNVKTTFTPTSQRNNNTYTAPTTN